MIESVDRIVTTPVRECPPLVEGVLGGDVIVATAWFSVEPSGEDWFLLTDVETGSSMRSRGETLVRWLKPEDMNNPAIQAELMLGLAEMGIEL